MIINFSIYSKKEIKIYEGILSISEKLTDLEILILIKKRFKNITQKLIFLHTTFEEQRYIYTNNNFIPISMEDTENFYNKSNKEIFEYFKEKTKLQETTSTF